MHRFYLPLESCSADALRIEGREAHHALHVLRVKRGEPIVVLNGAGHEFLCEIAGVSPDTVTLCVKQKKSIPAPPAPITLLVAIPKGKIIESIIQKSVELGACRLVPLLTERVVSHLDEKERMSKREKWQRVAIEAIKQCGSAWLPEIDKPATIEEVLTCRNAGLRPCGEVPKPRPAGLETGSESVSGASSSIFSLPTSAFEMSLVGSLQTDRRHPGECLEEFRSRHGRWPKSIAVWIGPEGDFTRDELNVIEASGALPISLGRLVLRVETAAIYCLSILNYELSR